VPSTWAKATSTVKPVVGAATTAPSAGVTTETSAVSTARIVSVASVTPPTCTSTLPAWSASNVAGAEENA